MISLSSCAPRALCVLQFAGESIRVICLSHGCRQIVSKQAQPPPCDSTAEDGMEFDGRNGSVLTRRRFISTAASTAALTGIGGLAMPAISRVADRPMVTHGIQSGDVSAD